MPARLTRLLRVSSVSSPQVSVGEATLCAADQRAQAGQQLFHVKRFGQVVVCTGVNAGDFFVPLIARREDQHRHRPARTAPALKYADAVELGQAEV
jgi:hypothetical protein